MSVQPELSAAESRRTLLLYCPYDRKVTRHARRGPANDLTCLECGRKLPSTPQAELDRQRQAIYAQDPAAMASMAEPTRSARGVASRSRRGRGRWIPLFLASVALVVSTLGAFHLGTKILGPSPAQESGGVASAAAAFDTLRIANTDGLGAYLRRTPNLEDRLRAWPDGTRLSVMGADTTADGIEWKQVQDPAGNRGWIPAQYTAPEPRR